MKMLPNTMLLMLVFLVYGGSIRTRHEIQEGLQLDIDLVIEHNADWIPVEQNYDGVEMVLVPAGCFMMGGFKRDNQPIHEQCFDEPFWIDKYEVTNELYGSAACEYLSSEPGQPRVCVSWFEARDFCASRNARLPTEAEWEYAARGPDSLVYPWGNEFVGNFVVYRGNSEDQTAEVGSRPGGSSWVGALDMSGNAWEWTSTQYVDYPYVANDGREDDSKEGDIVDRVNRGGHLGAKPSDLVASRRNDTPEDRFGPIGFRCIRSYTEDDLVVRDVERVASESFVEDFPVIRNGDWLPVEQDIDSVLMVLVPPGCFMMGDGHEAHEQCFDEPFWIDKYEVSNAQYGSIGCQEMSSEPNQPRNCVSWFEAYDFCASRDARLPTEAEWEYAARGPDSLSYPWGNEYFNQLVIGGRLEDVDSPYGGASWVGALHLSGNVAEWSNSFFDPYPYDRADGREEYTRQGSENRRVQRGTPGLGADVARAARRRGQQPSNAYSSDGFRCVRSFEN